MNLNFSKRSKTIIFNHFWSELYFLAVGAVGNIGLILKSNYQIKLRMLKTHVATSLKFLYKL